MPMAGTSRKAASWLALGDSSSLAEQIFCELGYVVLMGRLSQWSERTRIEADLLQQSDW